VRNDGSCSATICGEAAGLYYGLTTCGQSIAHTLEQQGGPCNAMF
jgi:hypothetical protein